MELLLVNLIVTVVLAVALGAFTTYRSYHEGDSVILAIVLGITVTFVLLIIIALLAAISIACLFVVLAYQG